MLGVRWLGTQRCCYRVFCVFGDGGQAFHCRVRRGRYFFGVQVRGNVGKNSFVGGSPDFGVGMFGRLEKRQRVQVLRKIWILYARALENGALIAP